MTIAELKNLKIGDFVTLKSRARAFRECIVRVKEIEGDRGYAKVALLPPYQSFYKLAWSAELEQPSLLELMAAVSISGDENDQG